MTELHAIHAKRRKRKRKKGIGGGERGEWRRYGASGGDKDAENVEAPTQSLSFLAITKILKRRGGSAGSIQFFNF